MIADKHIKMIFCDRCISANLDLQIHIKAVDSGKDCKQSLINRTVQCNFFDGGVLAPWGSVYIQTRRRPICVYMFGGSIDEQS